jgi:hypothetical protein
MGIATRTKIFIYPDETKLLLLKSNGLYTSDPDGSNTVFIQSGSFDANYVYDEATGFIYCMSLMAGDIWRNTTAFDFTAFTNLGNFFPAYTVSTGDMIRANNGRIIFGGGSYLRYTDNLFVSSVDVSSFTQLSFLLYEGKDNVIAVSNVANYHYYRSTDNGLTWPYVSTPLGLYIPYAGIKL